MSSFNDTSDWRIKDGTTLVYDREYKGNKDQGSSEKKPNRLNLQIERLSVLNTTSWELERYREPEEEAGFSTREFITCMGVLDAFYQGAILVAVILILSQVFDWFGV